MRILLCLTLVFSFSAFAQQVKENIKQQTVVSGDSTPVELDDKQEKKKDPPPAASDSTEKKK